MNDGFIIFLMGLLVGFIMGWMVGDAFISNSAKGIIAKNIATGEYHIITNQVYNLVKTVK